MTAPSAADRESLTAARCEGCGRETIPSSDGLCASCWRAENQHSFRWRIVNRKTNHRGLAGWNLWLNNELVMYRCYRRDGNWPAFKPRRAYIAALVKASLTGWTPWQMGLRKVFV